MWEAQRRLRRSASQTGHGVHSGRPCRATVGPAAWGAGLLLQVTGERTPIDAAAVVDGEGGCTRLRCGDAVVDTVEHLLAALVVSGITDAIIEVEGGEVPILDGSAHPWAMALAEAGLEEEPGRRVRPSRAVRVAAAGGEAAWTPGPVDEVVVHVHFDEGPQGSARWTAGTPAPLGARTFVLARDVERARAAGRGRGANGTNTWIHHPGDPADEAIEHLLIDAIGDRTLGGLVRGRAELWRPSHRLSHALWRAVAGLT